MAQKQFGQGRGFEVRVAHEVEHATLMAEEDPPEYALVDLNMPGANASGFEVDQMRSTLRWTQENY